MCLFNLEALNLVERSFIRVKSDSDIDFYAVLLCIVDLLAVDRITAHKKDHIQLL